ncbi:PAS domain S-box protein [Magnetovirga frankeli]|uniref:sensor domain-containing protein n=1 Tax=Magnetovirga frankeli TaxID=947516 RepID=UPI001292F1FC|nr:PAS domain S-box protein [gamma proteobacterium SS-5]
MLRKNPAVWITLIYLAFGSLWILLSDAVLTLLTADAVQLAEWQSYKGIAFILVTALLLFGLLQVRQRQLQRSETRFLATFEQAAVGLGLVAPDGRWLQVNQRLCALVGYSEEELLRIGFQDITHGEDLDADLDLLNQLLKGQRKSYSLEKRYRRKDGQLVWINLTVALVRDQQGQPDYFISVIEDIQARKQMELALQESETRLRLFIQHAPAALAMFDEQMRFMVVSNRWLSDYGLTDENIIGRSHYEVFPEIPPRWREVHQRALVGEVLRTDNDFIIRADGRHQWQRWEVRPWRRADGGIGGIVIFTEDISQQKEAELELRIAATAFETRQAMIITDAEQSILRVNQAFSQTTGYRPDEVIGHTPALLKSGRHEAGFYQKMWQELSRDHQWQGEIWNRRKNGEIYPEWLHISAVLDEQGHVCNYIGAFEDISQHKQAEAKIHSLSYFDVLTKLPNRRLFMDRLQQALLGSKRLDRLGAVYFIDLDGFSALNDTQSHDVGDRVLIEIAQRLVGSVHGDDTVARFGSDEFVVVVENLHQDKEHALVQAKELGERLLNTIRQPIPINGSEFVITASMGISLFDGNLDSMADLLRRADASMLQVKGSGRDRLHFFDHAMQQALEQRVGLEALLRKAIPEQLVLHYQLQANAQGEALGAEILVRWQDPERGLISPAAFIPLAEQSGLILPMGQWILRSACRQLEQWQGQAARRRLSLSVNVSPKQFQQADFVDQVAAALEEFGTPPQLLKLEITESLLLDDLASVMVKMDQIKALGVRFSLDDFGTGFSSLSYLKRLPFDQLKIDQSFVRDLHPGDRDAAIVCTIISLGQNLGMEVIAEGVETQAALDFLAEQGCNSYQGYLLARPMPIADFEQLLDQEKTEG